MTSPFQPGDVIAGKYRVERLLGAGGMGVVVLATHLHLEQEVAIKFLLPEALQNAEAIRRFVQEARAAARIRSEHVVRVFDVSTLENGAPYLVMEYLEGQDLDKLLRSRGPLPISDAIDYVLQACEALAEAHKAGIIHRDLKPANLYVSRTADGARLVKILDFGISKLAPKPGTGNDAAMTKTRALMGSPLYMSPEQMRSTKKVTQTADLWALGVILYELLAGAPPFVADSMPEICAMVLTDPLPPLRDKRGEVSEGLQAVIARCTAKDPMQRYQTVADLAEALTPFAPARSMGSIGRILRVVRGGDVGDSDVPPAPSRVEAPRSVADAPGSTTPFELRVAIGTQETMQSNPALDIPVVQTSPVGHLVSQPAMAPLPMSLPARTAATFGTTAPTLANGRALRIGGGVGVGVVALAVILFLSLRSSPAPTATVTASQDVPAASAAPPASTPASTPAPVVEAPVAPATGSVAVAVPDASAAVVSRPGTGTGTSKARPGSSPRPGPAGVPNSKPAPASTAGFGQGLE